MLRSAILIAASVALTAITLVAIAGPLTPPAGPPAPTFKTLDEVKPGIPLQNTGTTIQISTPGFYYLTEDVFSRAVGILITAPGVTLDLNGFAVVGNLSGDDNHHGIQLSPTTINRPITIRGGSIENFSGAGVFSITPSLETVLESVNVSNCGQDGVRLTGNLTARNSSAIDNGRSGFKVFGEARIIESIARSNGIYGFEFETGSIIASTATDNVSTGFYLGFLLVSGRPIVVADCVASNNGRGFLTAANTALSDSVAAENNTDGIWVGRGSTVHGAIAATNTGTGMIVGEGSVVSQSVARGNARGFQLGAGSAASACSAFANTNEGFLLSLDSRVYNCNADQNGTGFLGGADTTIDSCTATDNTIGIVGGAGGLVIRSTAAGNATAFDFTNSDHGPIVDLTTSSGAIAATNPFSNFSY